MKCLFSFLVLLLFASRFWDTGSRCGIERSIFIYSNILSGISVATLVFIFFFFLKILFIYFIERGEEKEKEGDQH